jgi:hypothetical protein
MSPHMQGPDVELEALPTAPVYELATFRTSFQDELPAHWPLGPGDARRSADGCAELLKIAADRWLLVQPRNDVVATARTALFDCPALLYKLNAGFSVWIERSYASAFVIAVSQAIKAQASLI